MLTYRRHVLPKALFALLAFAAAFLAFTTPAHADDRSYSIDHVQIDATVDEDGTLHVSETRTYNFHGQFNGVYQSIATIPDGSTLQLRGAQVRCGIDEELDLPYIPFKDDYGSNPAGAPTGQYSYDEDYSRFYVFQRMSDAKCDITVNYSITHFVQFYDDTADLYWQFIGDEWDVPNENIEARVTLPVPEGEKASAGENVLIYGHGPLDGDISLSAGVVHAYVPEAGDGDFAEMRVLYPRQWSNSSESAPNVHKGKHLDEAKAEEKEYIEAPIRRARYTTVGAGGVSIVALIAAFIGFLRRGREYRPVFKEKYWRDVPARDIHPAIVTRIWTWNNKAKDIPVTLMHLSNIGAIRLLDVSGPQYAPYNSNDKFAIVRVSDFKGELTKIDELVMDFLFRTVVREAWKESETGNGTAWREGLAAAIGGGLEPTDVVLFSDFECVARGRPYGFKAASGKISANIENQVEKLQVFEKSGEGVTYTLGIGAVVFWLAALGIGGVAEVSIWVHIGLGLAGFILLALAFFMRRRTPYANEIAAKSAALKRWLEDFSRLNEAPITDVKLWGELMVYAAAFGVADKAMEQLRRVIPSIPSNSTFAMGTGIWVDSDYYGGSSHTPFSSVSSSISSAHATATRDTYSSGGGGFSSSGSGGGGSFSGGGGGGFGGGGGGAF